MNTSQQERDPRRHIVILGGGMGSIMTAYQLTATEELRRKHRVTLYQMGWRLGGKLASGTNRNQHHRNEEHGLHVWFGFYDNAIGALRKCYGELLQLQPDFRYPTFEDAFKPNDFTPIGRRTRNPDGYGFWNFTWPHNGGTPGGCETEFESGLETVSCFLELIWAVAKEAAEGDLVFVPVGDTLQEHLANYRKHMRRAGEEPLVPPQAGAGIEHGFRAVLHWAQSGAQRIDRFITHEAQHLHGLVDAIKDTVASAAGLLKTGNPDDHPVLSALEISCAILKGVLNPRYGLLDDFNLNRIDDWDLRAWLIENGGDEAIVKESSLLRALYDIPFAYENGEIDRPNFAAGAALRWAIRNFVTYRGHSLYAPQTGFGDAVIGPYFKVLEARGVEFKFFHKVSSIELTPDRNQIARIRFDIQAETLDGAPYDPVRFEDRLYRWPVEPHWDQLKDGDSLRARGARFESHWNPCPPVGELVIESGRDFDFVVLGIAGTAMKKRNDEDKLFCQELIDASPRFAAWTGNLGTVCTSGVQFWFTKPVTRLGWPQRPATVGGPEPTDVWADMSPVLDTEHWHEVPDPPRSLHYLCGPLPTTLFNEPSSRAEVPAKAHQLCVDVTRTWVERNGLFNWPGARDANGGFDWGIMFDETDATGPERLRAQFLRANIDPTECCGNSFAGTTRHRPEGSDRLFTNLCIVGADTNTGINVTCVEGATISAMKASRSICGSPAKICHEHFMAGPFPPTSPK